jgi:pancreatic triacylglycerol lipase
LNIGDARYVEMIHTNAGFGGNGLGGPTADADFFVNGGARQPGCILSQCSHLRSMEIFIESLNSGQLIARKCDNGDDAKKSRCTGGPPGILVGGEPSNSRYNLSGIFHLETNKKSPFGKGLHFS